MPGQLKLPQEICSRDRQQQKRRDGEDQHDLPRCELRHETRTKGQRLRIVVAGVEHTGKQNAVHTLLAIHQMGLESRPIPRIELVVEVPLRHRMLFDIAMVHQEMTLRPVGAFLLRIVLHRSLARLWVVRYLCVAGPRLRFAIMINICIVFCFVLRLLQPDAFDHRWHLSFTERSYRLQIADGKASATMGFSFSMPQTQIHDLAELKEILKKKSIQFGDFTLSSGQKSDVYIDCKLTTCDPRAMRYIGRVFLQKMAEKLWCPSAVGGLTVGAEPIAFAIAWESTETGIRMPIGSFIVRKEKKPHGMQRIVEGIEEPQGVKAVIIDDVCTEGKSTALAIRNAKSVGMEIIGAVCLIDREVGASELLRNEFGLELASIFKLSDFR
jgi:orotate phosphoribosyltransferase